MRADPSPDARTPNAQGHDPAGLAVAGHNCWRVERADRAAVIIDAADYFRHARAAMLKARRRIMLVGWDFDGRIDLERGPGDEGPARVGDFLTWLVERNPDLQVYILRWDLGALKALVHPKTLYNVARWILHPRIFPRLDHYHPFGASHHQKILVIDDSLALCGGIDMTAGRWDTPEHIDHDPRRLRPDGKPGEPWHDAAWAVDGRAARALGDLCRMRWHTSGADRLPPITPARDCWPAGLEPDFSNVDIAIARTLPEMPDETPTLEIEKLYLDQIAATRSHLYIESQYFASRKIALALMHSLDRDDGPEVVIINPVRADGWLQELAMGSARARLLHLLFRHDVHGRMRVYHPKTAQGEQIYVHAKILIGDDRFLRIGSSNVNNRSMRLDTECDLAIDTVLPDNQACRPRVLSVRNRLIAEHLGVDLAVVEAKFAETGSLIATIEALRIPNPGPQKTLIAYELPELGSMESWLADSELLDPEGPHEMFEPSARNGLLRGLLERRRVRRGQKLHQRALNRSGGPINVFDEEPQGEDR